MIGLRWIRRGARSIASGRQRAVSAVVGKTLEAGIMVLYVSLLVSALYGGVVPEYRGAAGDELGDRVLAEAALEVQTAVSEDARTEADVRHDLPTSIRGTTYRIVAENETLRLVHSDAAVGGELPVALPDDVVRIEGTWYSHERSLVRVERTPAGRVVRLESVED